MKNSLFEQMGGRYERQGDYLLPCLTLPAEEEQPIGIWGQRHGRYLKEHDCILNSAVGAPLDRHLLGLIDKVNLTMKRRFAVGGDVDHFPKDRDVLRLQRVSSRAEQVERLPVQEENCLLRFMDDQLRGRIKILARMRPNEGGIVAFVFDNIRDFCCESTSLYGIR